MATTGAALTTDGLDAFLRRAYRLANPAACRLIQDSFNTHYLIETPDDRYVLRLYRHGWRTADDIAYELAVLDHLLACGVPVCGPIARGDETYQGLIPTEEGPRIAVLFRYAPGQPPDVNDPEGLRACGRTMALIHKHTDGYSCAYQRFNLDLAHLIEQPLSVLRPLLGHRAEDSAFVGRVAELLRAGLAAQAEGLEWGFCHGDFHGGNARVDTDGVLRVFDFDCGGLGWRAWDLAVCRLFCQQDATWDGFCGAYREVRPLTEATLAAIPWFLVTRQLWRTALFAVHWPRLMGSQVDDGFFNQHLGILRERISSHLPRLVEAV